MAISPLNRDRHGALRWRRAASFAFAAQRAAIPLVASELRTAAVAFPIAFIRQQDRFVPAAILGLERDRNLFVAEDGRWRGRYVPAELRSYPFTMQPAQDGRLVLCIHDDSACLTDSPDDMPLFTEQGVASGALAQVLEFLTALEQNRGTTAIACTALQAHGLIEPWPIAVRSEGGERKIDGLFRANEGALNALADEAFLEIRRAGALSVAYTQLLSMHQLPILGELAAARARHGASVQLGQDLDLSWLNSEIIKLSSGPGS